MKKQYSTAALLTRNGILTTKLLIHISGLNERRPEGLQYLKENQKKSYFQFAKSQRRKTANLLKGTVVVSQFTCRMPSVAEN